MDERARRVGENEALFREVNDRVRDLNETFAVFTEEMQIICECGNPTCVERLTLTPDEYRALRADPTRFALVPGHQAPDVETVVEQTDRFVVVGKDPGEPAELAIETAD